MSAAPKKKPSPSKAAGRRKFKVTFAVEVELEVSDDVISDALSDDFKASHYDFKDAAGVAAHLAYNMAKGASLSQLDGFAHWPNEKMKFVGCLWDQEEVTEEIK